MLKKSIVIIILLFLLISCEEKTNTFSYINSDITCTLDNTFYQSTGDFVCWNPENPEIRTGLCFDPLCSHTDIKTICPDNTWLWNKTITTDGIKLYLNVQNASLTDANNTMYRQIYSINPDGTNFTLLLTYDASGATSPVMQYSDGYLYFEQGCYRNKYSTDVNINHNDQYIKIMKIPTDGGKAESIFDDEMDVNTEFFVDDENYYLFESYDDSKMALTIINKETGMVRNDAAKNTEGILFKIRVYQGKTYLLTSIPQRITGVRNDGTTATKMINSYILYLYEDNDFRQINSGDFVFSSNGIWFSESDYAYVGTKTINSGAYGEAEEVDIFAITTKKLINMNPEDYSVQEYLPDSVFSFGDEIEIISGIDENLYVSVSNQNDYFENGNSGYYTGILKISGNIIGIDKIYE